VRETSKSYRAELQHWTQRHDGFIEQSANGVKSEPGLPHRSGWRLDRVSTGSGSDLVPIKHAIRMV